LISYIYSNAVSLTLTSCSDDLDIQQSYPFTVETMPVPKELTYGETAEIRCELKCEGDYANTLYTIRYFQYDGKGVLRMENGTILKANDCYLLQDKKFRLYYTSRSDESHNFIVVIENNFGNSYEMEFELNATSSSEDEEEEETSKSGSTDFDLIELDL